MGKKILLLVFLLVILSGCSVSYEMELYKNGKVNEKVYFIENNSVISKYGSNIANTINDMVDYYFSYESNVEPQILLSDKKNIKNIGDSESYIYLNKDYLNLNNYEKSLFGTYFFDTFKIDNVGEEKVIYANNLNYDKITKLSNDYKYKFNFDTLNIRIKIPYMVSYNNADLVEDDVYTWIFNKNNYSRDVKIIYNEDEIVVNNTSNNVNTLDKIGEVIINTVTLGTVASGKISKGNGGIIIFGVVLVLVVGGILIFRKIVNKRNSI